MPPSPARVVVITEPTERDVVAAARIWTAATARRDGRDAPEPWERQLDGVRARLASPGAALFLATGSHGSTGFAVAGVDRPRAELFYLAVDPRAWGHGTAAALLAEVERWAGAQSATALVLWVLDDNTRARDVYARAGWVSSDQYQYAQPSGRLERRLTRALPGLPSPARS